MAAFAIIVGRTAGGAKVSVILIHLPDAVPFVGGCAMKFRAARRQGLARSVVKFFRQNFKLLLRVAEPAKKIFIVGRLVTRAQFRKILRRAGILALEQFHRLALALDDDAIHEPRAVCGLNCANASRVTSIFTP